MNISINNNPADITLDTEKTLGDVMTGIEQWLSPLGNRIQTICVDGKKISEDELSVSFGMEIKNIKHLEISVSAWRELAAEALEDLYETCETYSNAAFSDRLQIASRWKDSAAARFLSSDIADMYSFANLTLSGEGLSAMELNILVNERLRELTHTADEIKASGIQVGEISRRMEDLPLDMQTGKDQRAAETIQHFSRIGEKLFRIFFIYKSEGLSLDTFFVENTPCRIFIEEFNSTLRELSQAYEINDTVLVGDLAEYELAPRLVQFYSALKNYSESSAILVSNT